MNWTIRIVVNILFGIIVLLNLTEAFRVFAFVLNLPTFAISAGSLVINFLYIFANYKSVSAFISLRLVRLWLSVILIFPIVMMMISVLLGYMSMPDFIYYMSFTLLFGTLFFSTIILSYNTSEKWIRRMIWISIGITIVGFILNYTWLELFVVLGNASNTDKSWANYGTEITRGMSFFLAPNRAAFTSVCFLIVLLTTGAKPRKFINYLFTILLVVGMIFATGSRTSLLVIFILLLLYFTPLLLAIFKERFRFRTKDARVLLLVSSIIGFVAFFFTVNVVSDQLTARGNPLGQRLDFFNQITSSVSGQNSFEDDSWNSRITSLGLYIEEIKSHFLFGVGPSFIRLKLENGQFEHVSQNQLVEGTLEYGIFYTIFYCYVLVITYFHSKRGVYHSYFFNPILVFTVFIFILGFSINDLYWNRPIVVILGILLGQYYRKIYNINQI